LFQAHFNQPAALPIDRIETFSRASTSAAELLAVIWLAPAVKALNLADE
jgi:hypothetical protein